MCYCGCQFERYPKGPNEDCICRKPRGCPCPMDVLEDDEDMDILQDDEDETEDDD